MNSKPILIAYATRAGSTQEVAEDIQAAITAHGDQVEMLPINKIMGLEPYRAVILGSAIRAGKWSPEAVEFVKRPVFNVSSG